MILPAAAWIWSLSIIGVCQAFVSFSALIVPARVIAPWNRGVSTENMRSAQVQERARSSLRMHKVTIEHDGQAHELQVADSTTILDAALDNNIELPHDCKLGVCLTCPSKIISGEVDQGDGTLDDSVVQQGFALTCCAYPRSDLVIRSVEEDELVGAQFSDRS